MAGFGGGTQRILLASLRPGPFLSGSSNLVYQLGQRVPVPKPPGEAAEEAGTPTDAVDGGGLQAKAGGRGGVGRSSSKKSAAARALGKKGRGAMTLGDLIEAGVMIPGKNKITVVYKGVTYTASLNKDGMIVYQGKKFQSATSFSIHCKRLQTPNKQGDDGWKSVLYEGMPLEHYRKRYYSKARTPSARRPASEDGSDAAEDMDADLLPEPLPQPVAAEPEVEGTDQWVQCDRCRTWRIVPDAAWPGVEADTREVWVCEYATWDVTQLTPFTPSCVTAVR